MKKLLLIPALLISMAFIKERSQATVHITTAFSTQSSDCGDYKGKKLYRGPKGGCYYINKNGNKTYVDRSFCKC